MLVVPTSTSAQRTTEYCVELNKGQGNLPKKCWARVTLTQPLAKSELRDYCGRLYAAQVELLEQNLLAYMGLVD